MATYGGAELSGSTDGKAIKVAATSIGSGTTIHTAQASLLDYITVWASNPDTSDHVLTLGWGGTTDPDDLIIVTIPAKSGLVPVVVGLPLTNSLVVKAAADAANKVVLLGKVVTTS